MKTPRVLTLILTHGAQRLPAHLLATARITEGLLSPGCAVDGPVPNSILSPDVVVEEGALVEDSVVPHAAHIKAGASVQRAIVDERDEISANATVGGVGELIVIGHNARIAPGRRITPGEQIPPG